MKKISNAFTLVELIIVITILAILATIAFVSFQNYTKDTRDANRLASLKNIENGLQTFHVTTGKYPEPENYTIIQASGTTIGYQGYIGDIVSKQIKINKTPLDPFDQTKYVYYVNVTKNKYQLLTYLENNNITSYINNTYAIDYLKRNIKVVGDTLGILLNQDNSPITLGTLDVVNYTGSTLKAIIDNTSSGIFNGTGAILRKVLPAATLGNFKSCNDILQAYPFSKNIDDYYQLNPTGNKSFKVYCDMTTDGGGWTQVFYSTEISVPSNSFDGKDWGSGSSYSYLESFKNIKRGDKYEFFTQDDEGKSIRFSQNNRYDESPLNNNYVELSRNGFLNNVSPEAGWLGLALSKYGNSDVKNKCLLSITFGQANGNRRGCLQDNEISNWGVAPYSHSDIIVNSMKIFQR